MKKLMIGNEAIALGAYEAGAKVAAAYPGTPSTEIVSSFALMPGVYAEWSPNEKVAMEVGIGSSIAGARTLVAMKHVGVNVAADPLYTFAYTGVNGGLVIVSADDPGMHSSQNEQDNRGYGLFAKIPVLEPSDSQEAKDYTRLGFEISERFDTPVMLRVTTRLCHSQSMVDPGEKLDVALREVDRNSAKYTMLPVNARPRHAAVEKRMLELKKYSEEADINRIEWGDRSLGIVTSGVVYQYVREVLPDVSVLKLGLTNPMPENLVRSFAAGVDRVVVVEELEPVMENQIKAWGIQVEGKSLFTLLGEYSPEMIEEIFTGKKARGGYAFRDPVPGRPPLMCPGCPHRGIFHVLHKMKLFVSGDIGCYTLGALPPLDAMNTGVCMGASIGGVMGMEKARGAEIASKSVAVIGDSTFVHSGITPLIDIVYNQATSTVIILDNDTTAMTGHQEHPATGRTIKGEPTMKLDIKALARAVGVKNVRVVDPLNLKQVQETIKEELERREPSVIVAERPCALLVKEPPREKYYVDTELCKGCKLCIRLGCTGISWLENEKIAVINPNSCVSCGLCPQVCTFDAVKVIPPEK